MEGQSGKAVPANHLLGPRAALVFFDSPKCQADSHRADWRTRSGVHEKSAVCREHALLFEALRLGITLDQLDFAQSIPWEFSVRRFLQIETPCSVHALDIAVGFRSISDGKVHRVSGPRIASGTRRRS